MYRKIYIAMGSGGQDTVLDAWHMTELFVVTWTNNLRANNGLDWPDSHSWNKITYLLYSFPFYCYNNIYSVYAHSSGLVTWVRNQSCQPDLHFSEPTDVAFWTTTLQLGSDVQHLMTSHPGNHQSLGLQHWNPAERWCSTRNFGLLWKT